MLCRVVSSSPILSFMMELKSAICSSFINCLTCSISELVSLLLGGTIALFTTLFDSPYDLDCFSSLPINLFSLSNSMGSLAKFNCFLSKFEGLPCQLKRLPLKIKGFLLKAKGSYRTSKHLH